MNESLTALYLQNPQLAAALRRQAFSQQLGKDATSFEPIQSPWQGVAKLANAGLSAFLMNKEDEDIKGIVEDQNKRSAANAALVASLINPDMSAPGAGGGTPQPSMTAAALQGKPLGNALDQVPAAPAIIHQNESGGAMRPGIYGDGGQAAGPMQVHPGALADVNKRYNTNYTHADLATNPDVGKKVGDAYYGILLEQFGGDQAKATAAYNAGSGRVAAAVQAYGDDWQKGLPPGTQAYLARGAGAQTTQGQGAPQPQQPQGGTMDAPAVMAQAKKMIVVGMNMANSADPRERMMGNELAAQGRHMQNQAQAELTRLDARANREMKTIVLQDPTDGKNYTYENTPNGPGRKIGLAPQQDDKGPLSNTNSIGNTMRDLAPQIIAGKATPAQIELFTQAAEQWGKASFDTATGKGLQGAGYSPQVQKALDVLQAQRQQAAPAASANPMQQPPVVEVTPSGSTRTTQPPSTSPQAFEDYRKAQVEANRLQTAVDDFLAHLRAVGGTGINTYLDNPRDPSAIKLNQLHDRIQEVLRSDSFMNTGVLQPAEAQMVRDKLLDPRSWRGLIASNESYQTMADVLKNTVRSGLDIKRKLAGIPDDNPASNAPNLDELMAERERRRAMR